LSIVHLSGRTNRRVLVHTTIAREVLTLLAPTADTAAGRDASDRVGLVIDSAPSTRQPR